MRRVGTSQEEETAACVSGGAGSLGVCGRRSRQQGHMAGCGGLGLLEAPEKGDATIRTVFWAFDLGIHVENGLGGGGKLEVGSQRGGESHGGLSCPVAARREGETPPVKTGSGQDGVCRRE